MISTNTKGFSISIVIGKESDGVSSLAFILVCGFLLYLMYATVENLVGFCLPDEFFINVNVLAHRKNHIHKHA